MSITIKMSHAQQQATMNVSGEFKNFTVPYLVSGVSGDPAYGEIYAMKALRDVIPRTLENLPLARFEVEAKESDAIYRINAIYEIASTGDGGSSDNDDDNDEPTVSFDCGGGTRHVETSLNQQHLYGEKDAGGLINWNGKNGSEMEVRGVDVPTAQLRKTYTRTMRLSEFSNAYERKVANLVGSVNESRWKGWEAGEVMFLGCSFNGQNKSSAKISVNFNFSIQLNEKNAEVHGIKFFKRGFEYVWCLKKTVKGDAGTPKAEITDLYVDQVVPYADFSDLGV